MSEQIPNPNLAYVGLEELASQQLGDVIHVFNDSIGSVPDRECAFVQRSLEFTNPRLPEYTDALARLLAQADDIEEAQRVSYRAFHFSYTLAGLIIGRDPAFEYSGGLVHRTDASELKSVLVNHAHEYLHDRPNLDSLIAEGMHEIDPYAGNTATALTVSGITLAFIDEAEKRRAQEAEIAHFSQQLENWDGLLH